SPPVGGERLFVDGVVEPEPGGERTVPFSPLAPLGCILLEGADFAVDALEAVAAVFSDRLLEGVATGKLDGSLLFVLLNAKIEAIKFPCEPLQPLGEQLSLELCEPRAQGLSRRPQPFDVPGDLGVAIDVGHHRLAVLTLLFGLEHGLVSPV